MIWERKSCRVQGGHGLYCQKVFHTEEKNMIQEAILGPGCQSEEFIFYYVDKRDLTEESKQVLTQIGNMSDTVKTRSF